MEEKEISQVLKKSVTTIGRGIVFEKLSQKDWLIQGKPLMLTVEEETEGYTLVSDCAFGTLYLFEKGQLVDQGANYVWHEEVIGVARGFGLGKPTLFFSKKGA